MAAVYSDVILKGGAWDCETCGHSSSEWTRRGRCTGPIVGGVEQLPIMIRKEKIEVTSTRAYPAEFDQCPRALIRADIYPAEVSTAALVSQAVHAEMKRHWPEVPARLWELMLLLEGERERRESAHIEAQYEAS